MSETPTAGPAPDPRPTIVIAADDRAIDTPYGTVRWHGVGDAYVEAVRQAGGFASIAPVGDAADAPRHVAAADGLLLVGGGDVCPRSYGQPLESSRVYQTSPARDAAEHALLSAATARRVPILCVCRGLQMANVWAGGSLAQDLGAETPHWDVDRPNRDGHPVRVVRDSLLGRLAGGDSIACNSLHHQAVDRVGAELRAVARSPDGVVEALEHRGHPGFLAVQWHPEMVRHNPTHRRLFTWLIEEAAACRERRAEGAPERGERVSDPRSTS